MKAKKILHMLKDIEDKKERQTNSREEALKKKEDAKEGFLKCKSQCLCQQPKSLAIGLKQCPVYQDILKSNCSKGKYVIDGKKPVMVLPAAATTHVSKKKVARDETSDSDSDEIESFEEIDTDMDVISESDTSIIDDDNDDLIPTDILRSTWETLSPPVPEEDVLGKWYTVICYQEGKTSICRENT